MGGIGSRRKGDPIRSSLVFLMTLSLELRLLSRHGATFAFQPIVSPIRHHETILRSRVTLRFSPSPDGMVIPDTTSRDFFEKNIAKLQELDLKDLIQSTAEKAKELENTEKRWSQAVADTLLHPLDDIQPIWLSFLSLPILSKIGVIFVPLFLVSLVTALKLSYPKDGYRKGYEPYSRGMYDPLVARAYYSRYPLLVASRALQLLRYSNRFIFNLLIDKYIRRDEEKFRTERAAQLLDLINKAGPTAIKVGQALSVRPDLIPIEYADALSSLQDRVPPFPSEEARELLGSELGESKMEQVREILIDEPVAAASIGQVYRGKARLSDGSELEVAIKVQRPDILSEISLDLHIVREFAPYYQKLTGAATDLRGLAVEWGRGFIAELDYTAEALNTKNFNQEMQTRGLNAVAAPNVIDELSTSRILTTEWVYGTRLDQSTAADVPRLCTVALNAYLVMLLETGCLHCDPHPGNLLRRDDGKLCILDFGMTLQTDPSLQYSLLEFVAHLTAEEYDEVPNDLVKLGFLKAERLDTVRASGFLEPLTLLLKQAGKGGGGKKVRERIFAEYREKFPGVDDDGLRVLMREDMKARIEEARKRESAVSGITLEVEELQKRNKDAFIIPEWFLYTSRAFLTLEGICLQANEDYSIIKSCYPYVARRLLGDDSPRAQVALRELLYGAGSALNAKRLTDLADGFTTYVSTTKSSSQEAPSASNGLAPVESQKSKATFIDAQNAIELAKSGADIILAPKGNLIQNILVDEGAAAFTAKLKDSLRYALVENPNRIRSNLPLNLGSLLPKPFENEISPFLRKTAEEERAQNLVKKLVEVIDGQAQSTGSDGARNMLISTERLRDLDPEQLALVSKTIRENLPKYAPLFVGLGGKFSSTLLEKLSDDIERALMEGSERSPTERLIRNAARGISSAAKQGAERIQRWPTTDKTSK